MGITARGRSEQPERQYCEFVRTGGASVDGRNVTFAGRIEGAGTWYVGFKYADYNDFWTDTEMRTVEAGERFSVTTRVPYSGYPFPYVAVAVAEPGTNAPAYSGAIRQVEVPFVGDTVEVETVGVVPEATTALVRGRIADFGEAEELEVGAHLEKQGPGPTSYTVPTRITKERGDDPNFEVPVSDLEPDTTYTVRAYAALPAGPVDREVFGEPLTFATDPDDAADRLTLVGGSKNRRIPYEFTVEGSVRKSDSAGGAPIEDRYVTVDDTDVITDGHVKGRLGGGGDAYLVSGDVTGVVVDGDADVYLNGNAVSPSEFGDVPPHHLVVFGGSKGNRMGYEFGVSGEVRKSGLSGDAPIEDQYVTVDDTDVISGSNVSGRIAGGGDAYRFSGELRTFEADGDLTVYLDGEEIDVASV